MSALNIRIRHKEEITYTVYLEPGIFKKIPDVLKGKGSSFVIITDIEVQKLFGKDLLAIMRKKGLRTSLIALPKGEKSKRLLAIEKIGETLVKIGIKRDSVLIALGGGVIGDITGFIASIFMRGISYINIPTTLLSMTDSCLGGKTGVDLESGKNMLGTFHQPKMIFIDPLLLKTLPDREFRNGCAEIVKGGVLGSPFLFQLLEKNISRLRPTNTELLTKIINQSLNVKKAIIEQDSQESFPHKMTKTQNTSRMLLNYGHTIGHALEKLTNYEMRHGEAISIGMVAENRLALGKKLMKEEDSLRIRKLLSSLRLPVEIPTSISPEDILKAIRTDKKVLGGKIFFALPRKIGKVGLFSDIV